MYRVLALLVCLSFYSSLQSQKLSGKWIGYFTSNADLDGKTYPYEITIADGSNNQINATTLTKFSSISSATAFAKGTFTAQTSLLNIQETKFDLLHLDPNMHACLMNNYLSYRSIQGHEVLQGTYMAKNAINGKDCGTGTVYLMKEDPIVSIAPVTQKKNTTISKSSNIKQAITSHPKPEVQSAIATNNTTSIETQETSKSNKFAQADNIILSNNNTIVNKTDLSLNSNKPFPIKATEETHEHIIIPWVLISRENNFVKKIITHNKIFSFDLYDNGTIDNDSITIYDNKKLMLDKNRLSYKPIHVEINFTDKQKVHEIIVVANNLGSVPPNTALLMYKDVTQTEEILINTSLNTNAKLIIEYQPPSK